MDGLQTGQNEINQFKSPVEVEEEKKPAAESAVADPEAPQETTIEELPADGIKEDSIRMVM